MIVRELTFDGFRNLHPGRWTPSEGVNILYGDNAQGKTKDSEMVSFEAEQAKLALSFVAEGRQQEATIAIHQRRQVTLNGVSLPSAARLAGHFCGVVFSPAHLSLIKDGPEGRRRFVDSACCQLRPGYVSVLAEYNKALIQRNAFLKQCKEQTGFGAAQAQQLDLWDYSLAAAGARVTRFREEYVRRLQPLAANVYAGLSGGREQLAVAWEHGDFSQCSPADIGRYWMEQLAAARRADLAVGHTTVGPHRADLSLTINELTARNFGSQGQQRSAVLALKLAEASLLQEVTGETPVAFLDDVMSELDSGRQDYILNHIEGWQVFITCCEPSAALKQTAAKVFSVKQGVISE